MNPPLPRESTIGPYLKLERAYVHINNLDSEIAAFIDSQPYRVFAEEHVACPGELCWTVRGDEKVPRQFPAIVSDAIQNLRASLDLAMCSIARFNKQSVSGIQFPTAESANEIQTAVASALKNRVGAQVEAILEGDIQPYRGGNSEELWALHKLAVRDKHRLLTQIASALAIHTFTLVREPSRPIGLMQTFYGPLKDGAVTARTPLHPRFQVGDEIKTAFEITFDDSAPVYQDLPVVSTLRRVAKKVEHALYVLHPFWGPPV